MHTSILKRVGGVLLAAGLIDIAVMIYCIINRISYSSSFNIFAVLAGIFLLRGSLRAASVVRWLAVFMLAAFATLLIVWPFMQPFDLTVTQIRLAPGTFVVTTAFMVFVFGLLFWLARELGREPIQAARTSAGRKQRNMRIPAAVGVGLVAVMGVFLTFLLGGESAERAKSMAEQQIGSGYRFYVSSLNIAKNNQGTFVSGIVTAWNDKEIKNIPVRWEEH
ncbi:hypothetical protein DWG20_15260 [Crenobacter cavernae]|uniref:Uncharacterized protein n=1 Tax=Crenobacter cavernae TaxID=2290923 RepID=A0A345Y9R7_9NEIS|nr:hypothetical protein DWG20_15260 [Crenobacter cavernae]